MNTLFIEPDFGKVFSLYFTLPCVTGFLLFLVGCWAYKLGAVGIEYIGTQNEWLLAVYSAVDPGNLCMIGGLVAVAGLCLMFGAFFLLSAACNELYPPGTFRDIQ